MSGVALALLGLVVMQELPPGLSFGDGIPNHERVSIHATFEQVLPRACQPPPCTEDCPKDVPTIGLLIAGNTRDYTLHWEATVPELDTPLTLDSRCDLCSLAEFEGQFASDLHALCGRLGELEIAPGRLTITSEPAEARLRIDGRLLGRQQRTPWVGELSAGDHSIEVRAPGYHSQERTVQVASRIGELQHFVLLPSGSRRPRWPGWTTAGLGVVMGVAGSVLIALDNKPWQGRCMGRNIDAYGNCQFVYSTLPLGIGLSVAGAVAAATGVGLVVWAQHDNTRETGAGLALQGRF